jgi:hypothetical protein
MNVYRFKFLLPGESGVRTAEIRSDSGKAALVDLVMSFPIDAGDLFIESVEEIEGFSGELSDKDEDTVTGGVP